MTIDERKYREGFRFATVGSHGAVYSRTLVAAKRLDGDVFALQDVTHTRRNPETFDVSQASPVDMEILRGAVDRLANLQSGQENVKDDTGFSNSDMALGFALLADWDAVVDSPESLEGVASLVNSYHKQTTTREQQAAQNVLGTRDLAREERAARERHVREKAATWRKEKKDAEKVIERARKEADAKAVKVTWIGGRAELRYPYNPPVMDIMKSCFPGKLQPQRNAMGKWDCWIVRGGTEAQWQKFAGEVADKAKTYVVVVSGTPQYDVPQEGGGGPTFDPWKTVRAEWQPNGVCFLYYPRHVDINAALSPIFGKRKIGQDRSSGFAWTVAGGTEAQWQEFAAVVRGVGFEFLLLKGVPKYDPEQQEVEADKLKGEGGKDDVGLSNWSRAEMTFDGRAYVIYGASRWDKPRLGKAGAGFYFHKPGECAGGYKIQDKPAEGDAPKKKEPCKACAAGVGIGLWWTCDVKRAVRLRSIANESALAAFAAAQAKIDQHLADAQARLESCPQILAWSKAKTVMPGMGDPNQIPVPRGLSYKPYQSAGTLFMDKFKNTLLADEMGTGKCLRGDTILQTDQGLLRLEEIAPRPLRELAPETWYEPAFPVQVWTGTRYAPVKRFYYDGVQKTKIIRTRFGYGVEGSARHPVLIRDENGNNFSRLPELAVGDYVVVNRSHAGFATQEPAISCSFQASTRARTYRLPTHLTPELARLLGYMVSEGNINNDNSFLITQQDPEAHADIRWLLREVFGWEGNHNARSKDLRIAVASVQLVQFILDCGITKELAGGKVTPWCVLRGTRESQRQFLRGIFEGDGGVRASGLEYCSKSERLARELQTMLLSFGVVCNRVPKLNKKYNEIYWILGIYGDHARRFRDNIGFVSSHRCEDLRRRLDQKSNSNLDVIPQTNGILGVFRETLAAAGVTRWHCGSSIARSVQKIEVSKLQMTYQFLTKLVSEVTRLCGNAPVEQSAFLDLAAPILRQHMYFDRIVSIEDGECPVMDIEVDDEGHRFVGNGLINHNCVVKETVLRTEDGGRTIGSLAPIPLADMVPGTFYDLQEHVEVWTGHKYAKVLRFYFDGERDTKILKTLNGRTLEGSHVHPILASHRLRGKQEWIKLPMVKLGDCAIVDTGAGWTDDPIVEITDGRCVVVDIEIDDPEHAFVGNGFINHNTIQALALCNMHPEFKKVLVVCPATPMHNWAREAKKWLVKPGQIEVLDAPVIPNENSDFIILNYDKLVGAHGRHLFDWLMSQQWSLIIFDESHLCKLGPQNNAASPSKRTVAVFGWPAEPDRPAVEGLVDRADRCLFLTGTPIPNRPIEIWPLLNHLSPGDFGDRFAYGKKFCDLHREKVVKGGERERVPDLLSTRAGDKVYWMWGGAGHAGKGGECLGNTMNLLQAKLRCLGMIRRLKKDVLNLPPKIHKIVYLPDSPAIRAALQEEQRSLEQEGEAGLVDEMRSAEFQMEWAAAEERAKKNLDQMSTMDPDSPEYMELQKQQEDLLKRVRIPFKTIAKTRHRVGEAKVGGAIAYIEGLLKDVGKVIVFAHHHDVIDQIERRFSRESVVISGRKQLPKARQGVVDKFQTDPTCTVFIGQTTACNTAITLTAANNVVFVEQDWTPGVMQQAEDRAHRIGQKLPVYVHFLVVNDSLDANMAETLVVKRDIIAQALDRDISDDSARKYFAKDLEDAEQELGEGQVEITLEEREVAPDEAAADDDDDDEPEVAEGPFPTSKKKPAAGPKPGKVRHVVEHGEPVPPDALVKALPPAPIAGPTLTLSAPSLGLRAPVTNAEVLAALRSLNVQGAFAGIPQAGLCRALGGLPTLNEPQVRIVTPLVAARAHLLPPHLQAAFGGARANPRRNPGNALCPPHPHGFKAYYNIDPNNPPTIAQILACWVENDAQVYDSCVNEARPAYYKTAELTRYREYKAQELREPPGTPAYEALKRAITKNGITSPLVLNVGRNGKVKIGEGNHRHQIALELGLDKVPVRFVFYTHVDTSKPYRANPRAETSSARRNPAPDPCAPIRKLGATVKPATAALLGMRPRRPYDKEVVITGLALPKAKNGMISAPARVVSAFVAARKAAHPQYLHLYVKATDGLYVFERGALRKAQG